MTDLTLFSSLPNNSYTEDDAIYLAKDLAVIHDNSEIINVPPAADLLFSVDAGVTFGGWRYTLAAIKDILRELSPSADQVFMQLLYSPLVAATNLDQSRRKALEFFNLMLTMQYPLIADRRLLVRRDTKEISGFARKVNQLLSNSQILTETKKLSHTTGLQFDSANLQGRQLVLRLYDPQSSIKVETDNSFHFFWRGLYIRHSEVFPATHSQAFGVVIEPCVLSTFGISFAKPTKQSLYVRCLEPFPLFKSRLEDGASRVMSASCLSDAISRLQSCPLGFTEVNDVAAIKWLLKFHKATISRQRAKRLLQKTLQYGVGSVDISSNKVCRSASPRTLYDLYYVLTDFGRDSKIRLSENISHLGYSILFPE